jgi:probable addiction module antidote protein
MPLEFEPFDISERLDSGEMIAGYLNAAEEDEDPNVLLGALAHAAKARGMMQVAQDAGLSRESLYKAMRPGAHPRFETIQAVLRALGVKLSVSARMTTCEEAVVGSDVSGAVVLDEGALGHRIAKLEREIAEAKEALGDAREATETAGKTGPRGAAHDK